VRTRCLVGLFILTLVVLGFAVRDGSAQFGFFDPKDSNAMFDRMVKQQNGQDAIEIDKVSTQRDPEAVNRLKAYAAKAGISNGKLTREQFADYWAKDGLPAFEERMKGFGKGGFGPPGGKDAPSPFGKDSFGKNFGKDSFGKNPGKDSPPAERSTTTEPQKDMGKGSFGKNGGKGNWADMPIEDRAKRMFTNMDKDGDGVISAEEMSDDLRANLAKWDTNKNGVIEWEEFLPYAKERLAARDADRARYEEFKKSEEAKNASVDPNGPPMPSTTVVEDKKPVIFRNDNLPKDLPDWFKKLDTDKDGQIGLYEWKAAGKDLDEFRKYDRNGDGFITVEEALWYEKNKERLAGNIPLNSTPDKGTFSKDKTASATDPKDKGFDKSFGKDKGGFFGKRDRRDTKDKDMKDSPAKE
jgi:Ca2+-binding EF-hand superfamily protein